MNKPYNIQNTNICNGIFHISFSKALLINEDDEDETTRAKGIPGETTQIHDKMVRTNFKIRRWHPIPPPPPPAPDSRYTKHSSFC